MPELIGQDYNENGDLLVYPEGDKSVAPSSIMPKSGYFFDAIPMGNPVIDEATLKVDDNLEEFKEISESDLTYWKSMIEGYESLDKALTANFGGTALGDIALIPAVSLKDPKGIRDIADWYISSLTRPHFLKELIDRQTDIAINNLKKIFNVVGNRVDVMILCGTDFGTQNSTFCDVETYRDIWMPYYKKLTSWVHENTEWKVIKHCCGAIEILIDSFIDSGFDILNPVQINAAGMDPLKLKDKYGDRIVFWGGGVDTQRVLPYVTPEEVEFQVLRNLEIFSKGGGFVFNTIHNVQVRTPMKNFIAMLNAVRKFNGEPSI